jgi:hypothetical protein
MLHAWLDLLKRLCQRTGIIRSPTPELTSLDNSEMYSLEDSSGKKDDSEEFRAPEPFKVSTNYKVNDPRNPYSSAQHPNARPLPESPTTTQRPPTPPLKSPYRSYRPFQPILPPATSSLLAHSSSTPSTIHAISPLPYLSSTRLSLPINPNRRPIASPPRLQTQRHTLVPSSTHTFHPSRPAPLPPRRQTRSSDQHSTPDTPISALSCTTCETRNTERSWRDSTISALDKVVVEDDSETPKLSSGLQISAPIEGSFKHVDGAFIRARTTSPFVFGDGWEEEDENIGRAR